MIVNMAWDPSKYDEAAGLAVEVGEQLLNRLQWMTLQPKTVLDLGCGVGDLSVGLQKYYPTAQIISLDHSESMLQFAKNKHALKKMICAEVPALPFKKKSIDLIVINLLLSWLEDSNALLQACLPLLSPDGILILSALGPDSLKELEATHSATIVPMRIDMHEVGDQLLHIGFKDPVLDVEHYTFSYKEPEKLHAELIASGMLMSHAAQPMLTEVTYEVFYAHAFGPPQTESFAAQAGNVNIPLQYLRNQLRNKNS